MFSTFVSMLNLAVGVTAPIFLLVFLGGFLRAIKLLDDAFMASASKLVFYACLPTLLFTSLAGTDIQALFNGPLVMIGLLGTLVVFGLCEWFARRWVQPPRDRGVFVQGAFRGNLGIVGLAFCLLAYGDVGLARAAILMSLMTLLYNILSILTLSVSLAGADADARKVLRDIAKNPLMIAIVLGVVVSFFQIPIPSIAETAADKLADLTLPLALICIGGTISIKEFKHSSQISVWATLIKLVVSPLIIVSIALVWGFAPIDIGILFFMVASPSAAASYVMAQAAGGNGQLAANIVVLTTLFSMLSVSVGLALLQTLGVA